MIGDGSVVERRGLGFGFDVVEVFLEEILLLVLD
jgi:hypothetical protein